MLRVFIVIGVILSLTSHAFRFGSAFNRAVGIRRTTFNNNNYCLVKNRRWSTARFCVNMGEPLVSDEMMVSELL